jgi:tetratricopeptide (TPR) repeat protein
VPQATKLLNEVLATNPQMPTALFFRAIATIRTPGGKPAQAIPDLSQVRELTPGNLQARYLLADCLTRTNDRDAAIAEYEGILRINPGEKTARLRLMDAYASFDPPRWLDAERVARDGDATPELAADADYLAAEARMYAKRGNADRAVASIKQAMKLAPQNSSLLPTYYAVLSDGKMYRQVVEESDKLPKEQQDAWWVHSYRGKAKCKLGDKDGGLKEFVTAITACFTAKDEAAAQNVIAEMLDSAGAESALKVVTALPQASEPRWQLMVAWLQSKKQDIPAARKTIEGVLANLDKLTKEQKETALGFAGNVYMESRDASSPPDHARAKELFLQLLQLRPDDFRVYNNLACNTAVSAEDVLKYSQKAYELMQQNQSFEPLVADTYGWALVESGNRVDEGINVLLDAWQAREIADTGYHLGAAYLKKNNPEEAEKYLARAQALFQQSLQNNEPLDVTLLQKINQAQQQAIDLKGKRGA